MMMKKLLLGLTSLLFSSVSSSVIAQTSKNFYDFNVKTIDGKPFAFSQLKGKRVLIVNTASKCGYTPQYAELEKLYKEYKNQNFVIVGFPANDFLSQEPGSNAEIKEFCAKNYGVSFPMFEKVTVKGDEMAEVYRWLTHKDLNGVSDSKVKWNFQKYMVDENGKLIGHVSPGDSPYSKEIIDFITKK